MHTKAILCSTVALLGWGLSAPAVLAQDTGESFGEVVVTARKREESILRVPVAATAITGQELEQFATGDLYAVTDRTPGLLIGTGTGSFGAQVSLRGVGTSTLNATIDQSVSLNLDGLQLTQGLAYQSAFFDLDQVELLRGPQALFFGKASPGGVIAVHSAGPTDEAEVILRTGYEFEAETTQTDLIVSGPLTDNLGVRLAYQTTDTNGFFTNAAEADPLGFGAVDPHYRDFGAEQSWIFRGTVQYEPTDRLSVLLKVNLTENRTDGDAGGLQLTSCPDGVGPGFIGIEFLGGGEDCRLDETVRIVDSDPAAFPGVRNNGIPFSDSRQRFGTLEINYDLTDALTLTSVTGIYSIFQEVSISGTNGTYAASTILADTDFWRREYTEELRLASDFDGPLNFTLGAFYEDGGMSNRNNLIGNTAIGLPGALSQGRQNISIDSQSVFGQAVYNILPDLALAGGLRWTHERRHHEAFNTISGTRVVVPTATPILDTEDTLPEISLTYTPTDDLTFFASYREASKSGSFDTVSLPAPGDEVSFGDEHIEGYEIGMKSRWFDRRVIFNISGYSYKYDDLQVGANETSELGSIDIRTLNAATAEIYGVDIEFDYLPSFVEGLTFHSSINYNHSRYDDFSNAQCYGGQTEALGCDQNQDLREFLDEFLLDANGNPDPTRPNPNPTQPNPNFGNYTGQDLSGRPLVRAPDWSASFGFDYEHSLPNDMWFNVAGNALYSDEYFTNAVERADTLQDAYWKTGLSVTLHGPDDAWDLSVIGNNLGNELTTGSCINYDATNGVVFGGIITGAPHDAPMTVGPGGTQEIGCDVDPGRQVWVRFTLRPLGLFDRR